MSQLHNPKITCLVLAAGSSSRMQSCKQLLPWGKTTLIEHTIQQLTRTIASGIFVVLGARFETIYQGIKHLPVTILKNSQYNLGMGTSVAMGVHTIQKQLPNCEGILITTIDQPGIKATHYEEMITLFKHHKDKIIASDLGKCIGVPVLFSSKFTHELQQLNKDYGARYLIKKYQDQVITVDTKGTGVDIDTPEVYKALYDLHHISKP